MPRLNSYISRLIRQWVIGLFISIALVTLFYQSTTAHKSEDDKPVHQYIAKEAYWIWPSSSGNLAATQEMGQFLDNGNDHDGWDYGYSMRDGDDIVEGAQEEDFYCPLLEKWGPFMPNGQLSSLYTPDILPFDGFDAYNTHFWDPDKQPWEGLNVLQLPSPYLFSNISAYEKAYWYMYGGELTYSSTYASHNEQGSRTIPGAIMEYINGNKGKAYYLLGRIAHLLADMSVPAHVHNDPHPPINPDSYEEFIADSNRYLNWCAGGSEPVPCKTSLVDLFWELAQITQWVATDDSAGNRIDGNDTMLNFDAWNDSVKPFETDWLNQAFFCDDSGDGPPVCFPELLTPVADRLMRLAFRYTAGLYKLFWETLNPTDLTAELIDETVRLSWNVPIDGPSGQLVSRYKIYWGTSPGSYSIDVLTDDSQPEEGRKYIYNFVPPASGTTYYFVVTPVYSTGKEGGRTDEASAYVSGGGIEVKNLDAYQNESIVTTQRISGTFELRARIEFDKEIAKSEFFYSIGSGNIWSGPYPMSVDNDPEWHICLSKGLFDTIYHNLGTDGDQAVWFKVRATDSTGVSAEKAIQLTLNNVQNVFYLSPSNVQIFQLSGTSEPISGEVTLENLTGMWKLISKPDFVRVQYLDDSLPTWTWVYVGTETEVASRYNKIRLEIVKDINRQPGTYTGEVVLEDLGTWRTARLSVKFIYASELPMNFDLEIPGEPVPVDADGNRLYAPFQENQTVYWQYTIRNNGPDTLPPTPNEIKNGFFVSPSRYDEPVNRPPSSHLRDERTAGNLDSGESRTYSDAKVTFTADDVGKELYLIAIADWLDRVGEGSYAYETNNYAVYGPFRVLPLPKPDFGLGLDPGSFNLPLNRLKATTVYVTGIDGFSDPVELTISGLPSGMAHSFGATPILPNQQTSLTLFADENVPCGTYTITVAGTGGGKSHSVQATVEVVEGGPPTLEITTNSGQDFETQDGQVVLEGTASDADSGLLSLTCNMSGTNQGNMENWIFTVDLAPGNNTIVVTATDLVSNTTQRTIHVYSTLTGLQVWPEQAKIKSLGATAQLQAMAFNSAGKSADLTSKVTWVSSDPGTATVSASGTVTAVGEGSATVTAEINGLTDACEVTVDTRPFIGVNKSSLSFSATYGLANPYPQTLEIWNDGGQLINWNLSENATWLFLSETSGSSEGLDNIDKLEVSVNIVGLAIGEYSCEIELSSPEAANSPIIIPVHLTIYPDNPFLQLLYPYDHKTTATLRPLFC